MSCPVLPAFEHLPALDGEVFSELFIYGERYSVKSRDEDFALSTQELIGIGAIRLNAPDAPGDRRVEYSMALDPKGIFGPVDSVKLFMEGYASRLGAFHDQADEMIQGGEITAETLERGAVDMVHSANDKGLRNAASVIVMGTMESQTSGLLVPRQVLDEVTYSARSRMIARRTKGEKDSTPDDIEQPELDQETREILGLYPYASNMGMLIVATLFPRAETLRGLLDAG